MKEVSETMIYALADVGEMARKVLATTSHFPENSATIVFLEGDLGAGKTTFTQALARELAVKEPVISPTFILKKSYAAEHPRFTTLIHIDAYRFEKEDEAKVLKLEHDTTDPHALIVIEWPYKMPYLKPHLLMELETIDENTRRATLTYEKES